MYISVYPSNFYLIFGKVFRRDIITNTNFLKPKHIHAVLFIQSKQKQIFQSEFYQMRQ